MSPHSDNTASQLLHALRSVLTQVAKPSTALKTILSQAVSQTGADRGVFVEVTRSGQLAYRVLYRFQREELSGEAGHFSSSIFSRVLKSGKGLRLDNALNEPGLMNQESIQDYKLISILCFPVRVDGRISALVHLESTKPNHFQQEHEDLLESLLELADPALGVLQAGEGVLRERDQLRTSADRDREEIAANRALLASEWSFGRFIGLSAAVRELESTMRKAAKTDFPVLMVGETGTGKSILSRVMHHAGPRSKQAFATVFCPSLEKGMVETELFGHKRGAFTGAVSDRIGKIQAAEKGTLFLDEIGELPLEIQPKLLRLLQERTYERVGDSTERTADVRVIAATNRDLEEEVRERRFRRDLYERLNYVVVRIPPLRERTDDIPTLLRHCLDQHDAGRWIELSDAAKRYLVELDYSWPGNVRTIEQLAVRLTLEGLTEPVTPQDVERLLGTSVHDGQDEAAEGLPDISLESGLPNLLAHEESKWIKKAIQRHPNLSRADLAGKLKISPAALYKKLKLYDIK